LVSGCPDHGEEPGRDNKISYCVNKCKAPCTSPNVLSAILHEESLNPHKGKIISVTQITGGCKRKTFLERTQDFYIEPDKKLPTFRGTLIHSLIEKGNTKEIKKAGWLIEQHMELPVTTKSGSWILSATLDAFDKKRKTLFDVKTLQEYAVEKMVTGKEEGTWSDHISDSYVKQANLYRYIGKKLDLFDAKRLRLQIIGFGRMILTGTTVKLKTKQTKWKEQSYELPDIPVLPDKVVESWINIDGDEWYRIMYGNEPAPVCDDDWKWLCKSCVFNGTQHCPDPDAERRGTWFV
jgi:hypothetical protein